MAETTPTEDNTLDELRDAAKAVTEASQERRNKAVQALADGKTIRAVAEAAGVAVNTLLKWRAEDK